MEIAIILLIILTALALLLAGAMLVIGFILDDMQREDQDYD
jgi:hypothetical protein